MMRKKMMVMKMRKEVRRVGWRRRRRRRKTTSPLIWGVWKEVSPCLLTLTPPTPSTTSLSRIPSLSNPLLIEPEALFVSHHHHHIRIWEK